MRLRGPGPRDGRRIINCKPARGVGRQSKRAQRHEQQQQLTRGARFRQSPVRFVPPTLVTSMGVACGVSSCVVAYTGGNLDLAGWLMVGSAIFDGLDGKVARLCHAESTFGENADSFNDFLAFGVAPAFMVHALGQRTDIPEVVSALVGLGVVVSVGYRLRRYMGRKHDEASAVDAAAVATPAVAEPDFYGLPSTAGGPLIAGAVMAADTYSDGSASKAIAAVGLAAIVSGLMVSRVPYRHLKTILSQPAWGLRWYGMHPVTLRTYGKLGIFAALTTASVLTVGPGLSMLALWGGYALLGRQRARSLQDLR